MADIQKRINLCLEQGAEYVDIRILKLNTENIILEDSIVSSIQNNEEISFSTRVFYKGAWGLVYNSNIQDVNNCLDKALKIAKLSSKKIKKRFKLTEQKTVKDNFKFPFKKNPCNVDIQDKIRCITEIDSELKKPIIKHKTVSAFFNSFDNIFLNSEGCDIKQSGTSFILKAMLVGKSYNSVVRAVERIGKKSGYENFEKISPKNVADRLYTKFLNALKADNPPAGRFPIVIDPKLCEVFFHEAVGHACEADEVLENSSVLSKKLGQKIAPEELTLIDTPLIENEFGYYKYDDEGIPAQKTILIKNGILSNFLQSRETASITGTKPTGNGRAESPSVMQIPRMSNTFLKPGKYSFEELFEGMKLGIYAKDSSGGVVEPNNGNFLFNADESFLIENGEITKPLKDVSFAGNIIDILQRIEKIGKKSERTFLGGYCGKKGQQVPVGGKAPYIKISEAIVGGRNS